MKFCGKSFVCFLATCRKTRGKPQRRGLGFPLKGVGAKCFVKSISPLSAKIYHKTLSIGAYILHVFGTNSSSNIRIAYLSVKEAI